MAKDIRKFAATSNTVRVFIADSSVTTGVGLTGVVYTSTGLVIDLIADNSATAYHYKSAATATIEDITTIGTFAAPSASNCRFKAVDATNFPGLYEIQFLDGVFDDASCKSLIGKVSGVTNMALTLFEIQLVAFDPQSATDLGLSSVAAILVDTGTTLDGRIPAALGADGFIKASVFGMMGTALTETAGQIAAAFVKFFNKATPTGTINSIPDAVPGGLNGLPTVDANNYTAGIAGTLNQFDDLNNAITAPTAAQNAAALLDLANGIETGLTPRQALRLLAAACAGKLSGAATTTIVIRNAVADGKDRITATVDADGNRSAITVDLT